MKEILVVEDDPGFSYVLTRALRNAGYEADTVGTGAAALSAIGERAYAAVLLDLGLPDTPGHDVLERLVALERELPVIVLSGRDEAASAVRALRCGAFHYLTKPITTDELLITLAQAAERAALRRRVEASERAAASTSMAGVGESPAWLRALESIGMAARAPRTPVLVSGESGTGKERCAQLVHAWSERNSGPFVAVNAAAFAPGLLESELFGHEPGAFTGARGQKRGVLELADGGTLFLDEIGELPLELQPKLLRVLDGHGFRRVGGEREIRVDVRFVSATNRSLERCVAEQRFRLDLYHRLRVVEVALPPLRERGRDVGLLAIHFLREFAQQLGRTPPALSADALAALETYPWPGNVRELRNVMERATVLCRDGEVGVSVLPREIVAATRTPESARMPIGELRTLEEVTNAHILATFRATGENLTRAARVLGVSRMTLRKRLRELGLRCTEGEDQVM